MIVFDADFPENCGVCPIRNITGGCWIAEKNLRSNEMVPEECPFEPAKPVDVSAVAEAVEESSGGFEVAEMICLMCLKRFIDVRPVGILLKNIECPGCHRSGFIIETGEYMTENNDSN